MGIPKFFRYIAGRYPLISQLIQENNIPEFDNLYLDFNGIIHQCSHPNDEDAHYRITEEQIFTGIFAYVDFLFSKIKPKKIFFMAVDGVAPRAKMNQQRGRRFRTAQEAREIRAQAERRGEKLPEEKAFDSNCITPGTPFMARLSEQLRYFVNKKVTEDADWQGVDIILSGHEVPGEGEHKIMEYIRLSKAQPGYNPNTRHCLYGLDADLIMLGLLSHDPHFCLLREEVKFGRMREKKTTNIYATNFYLLQLCLLREYLDLEFRSVAQDLPFEYNLERIIDDFVLLAVFVGNDFVPHLPDLHIQDNALHALFEIYKEILPKAGAYINNSGVINTKTLQMVLDRLAESETEVFYKETSDANWMQSKRSRGQETPKVTQGITKVQKLIFQSVMEAVRAHGEDTGTTFSLPNEFSARDRNFITQLASDLNLDLAWDAFDDNGRNVVTFLFPSKSLRNDSTMETDDSDDSSTDDEREYESQAALDRVLARYAKLKVIDDDDEGDFDEREDKRMQNRIEEWKRRYYQEKLEISYDDKESLNTLVFRWAEGLQWVMYYYYSGVASWSWFYDYHYAPRTSDLKGIDGMVFEFDLGEPFRPFQQLMGVLPEASKEHVPLAYRDLMFDGNSPILDFYPQTFELDLNGKKNDWEAVVRIPFIQQERLVKAMAARDHQLTPEEVKRNQFGTSVRFYYDPTQDTVYPSSLPGFFAAIYRCTCRMEPFNLPTLDGLHLVKGLCDGVFLGSAALAGFPSLHTIPHTGRLEHHRVQVFDSVSRNQSMVIEIENDQSEKGSMLIAQDMLGKKVYYGWPFLQEGLVVAVSDEFTCHELDAGGPKKIVSFPQDPDSVSTWKRNAFQIEELYSKRYAVLIGLVEVLLHVRPLKGLRRLDDGALVKDYEAGKEVLQAIQLALQEVISEDPRFLEKGGTPIQEEYPIGTKVIFLGEHAYGVAAQVVESKEKSLSVILAFFPSEASDPEKFTNIVRADAPGNYFRSGNAASMVGLSALALSRITSSLMVMTTEAKVNIGLCLKFEARGRKVMDYSRKGERGWEFSYRAIQLIRQYLAAFPDLHKILDNSKEAILRSSEALPEESNPDFVIEQMAAWLKSKGVQDFEQVPLDVESVSKLIIDKFERLADSLNVTKSAGAIKKAKVQGIPRQAILKPSHAIHRLNHQRFSLGDRVVMAQDSGGVPLCARGVVVGISNDLIDVVWDMQFISGTTLNGRCSDYRGSSVPRSSCLNLKDQQFCVSTKPRSQPAPILKPPPRAATGPHQTSPSQGRGGQPRASPGIQPTQILRNPNRPQPQPRRAGSQSGPSSNGNVPQASYVAKLKDSPPPVSRVDRLQNILSNPEGPAQNEALNHARRGNRRFNPIGRGGTGSQGLNPSGRGAPGKRRGRGVPVVNGAEP